MSALEKKPLPDDWMNYVGSEFDKPYMGNLRDFLRAQKQAGVVVFPKSADMFNAFTHTPFERVRVVVIGQDPYHGDGQAHGLCFSVPHGIAVPPSLVNIYKEIEAEFNISLPRSGNLESWADQGVLLLNATLSVERDKAGSHQNKGWEEFTDQVIRAVDRGRDHVVFMLWGAYAQKKGAFIDRTRHLVLTAPHPSPLSAHRGFLGCGHFKQANEYLTQQGHAPIDWSKVG